MQRYGMTIPLDGVPLHAQREYFEELAALGYTDLWTSEAGGTDGFTPLALASTWAPAQRLGCAIFPAYTRGPALLAMSAASLAQAAGKGFRTADAPVSGGTAAADGGTLAFMVGCDPADFADVETTLDPMSRVTIHAGDSGAGQAAKICNNMLLGISMIGTCEAFALADRLGLSAERFFEISSQSSGQNWSMTSYCPVEGVGPASPADRNFEGGFATDMMLKDLRLAKEAAMTSGAVTPMGGHAEALYAMLSEQGLGHKDFSSIIELLSKGTVK